MICKAPWPMVVYVPSVVGTLPTKTNPPRKTPRAVLSPGKALTKKVVAAPGVAGGLPGVNRTIVVPVPCRLALLLKLATKTSPGDIVPPAGNPSGTKATPYGLTSPLSGMVEELISCGINGSSAAPSAPRTRQPAIVRRLTCHPTGRWVLVLVFTGDLRNVLGCAEVGDVIGAKCSMARHPSAIRPMPTWLQPGLLEQPLGCHQILSIRTDIDAGGQQSIQDTLLQCAAPQRLGVRDFGVEHHHRVAGNEPSREAPLQIRCELLAARKVRGQHAGAHFLVVLEGHGRDGIRVGAPFALEARAGQLVGALLGQQPGQEHAVLEPAVASLAVKRD